MKKILIGTSLIMATTPITHAGVEDGQFAVLKTTKACEVTVPAGHEPSQVYFSKDCQSAFILPPQKMKAQVSEPLLLAGADDNYCKALDKNAATLERYQERITALSKEADKAVAKLGAANPDQRVGLELQIKETRKQIAFYKKELNTIMKPFDDMGAMRVKYTLVNDVMNSVRAFMEANPVNPENTSGLRPVRFMPAQITDSILSISNSDPENLKGRSAIRVNFPGQVAKPADIRSKDPNSVYVYMNGGMSGIVDISTSAWCKNKVGASTPKEVAAKSVAINLNYKVKVQTGVRVIIDAKIETKDFLRNMGNTITDNTYTRTDLTNHIVSGGLKNSIKIIVDDKGSEFDMAKLIALEEDSADSADPASKAGIGDLIPLSTLIGKVLSNYINHAEDKLEALGIIERIQTPVAAPKDGGYENVQVGTRTVCSSSSSWFGFVRSSSCRNEPIIVKVDQTGYSAIIDGLKDETFIQDQVLFESNQVHTVNHTSTFDN